MDEINLLSTIVFLVIYLFYITAVVINSKKDSKDNNPNNRSVLTGVTGTEYFLDCKTVTNLDSLMDDKSMFNQTTASTTHKEAHYISVDYMININTSINYLQAARNNRTLSLSKALQKKPKMFKTTKEKLKIDRSDRTLADHSRLTFAKQ